MENLNEYGSASEEASEDSSCESQESPTLGPPLESFTQVEEAILKLKQVEIVDSLGRHYWRKGRFCPADVWEMNEGDKIIIRCDDFGRPEEGKSSAVLASWLGTVARSPNLCPLHFNFCKNKEVGWRKMPKRYKQEILRITRSKFVCLKDPSDRFEKFVLRSVGKKVRDYKSMLKKLAFAKSSDLEEIKRSVPKNVDPLQWAELVKYWFTVDAKKLAEHAKVAREKLFSLHTTGPESFASAKHRLECELNRPVGMIEFYQYAHVHRGNGVFIDEEAASIMEKANAMLEHASKTPNQDPIAMEQEVFRKIVGGEKSGHVRGYGLGVCPSMLYGRHNFARNVDEAEIERRVRARLDEQIQRHEDEMKRQRDEMEEKMRKQDQVLQGMQEKMMHLQAIMNGFVPLATSSS